MELRVDAVKVPEKISFNFEELKGELLEKVKVYESIAYTEEQVKEAKADRASLMKLKKALNDERIRREREYMKPFSEFKAQIGEIIGIVDKPIAAIDKQVKAFEENRKAEKMKAILEYINSRVPSNIDPELLIDQRWLNATVSMKQIQAEIDRRTDQIQEDLKTLEGLEKFGFEAAMKYRQTLDFRAAMAEANRLSEMEKLKAKMREEEERRKEEKISRMVEEPVKAVQIEKPSAKPERAWVTFRAKLSADEAKDLNRYFRERNILFERA